MFQLKFSNLVLERLCFKPEIHVFADNIMQHLGQWAMYIDEFIIDWSDSMFYAFPPI